MRILLFLCTYHVNIRRVAVASCSIFTHVSAVSAQPPDVGVDDYYLRHATRAIPSPGFIVRHLAGRCANHSGRNGMDLSAK